MFGTLKDQSCAIPSIFSSLAGYNMPECSKHRKRSINNLTASTLKAIRQSLDNLTASTLKAIR